MEDEEIQGVSQEKFKTYIKAKVKIKHLKNMNILKKSHSKSTNLKCEDLKLAEYLKSPVFNTKQKKLLFKLRSRTIDVKMNFPGQHKNLMCRSCELVPESQGHLLQCPKLVTKLNYLCGKTSKLNEYDIYSDDISKQEIIVNIYSDLLEVRENLEHELLCPPYLQG